MHVLLKIDYHKPLIHEVVALNEWEPHLIVKMVFKMRVQELKMIFVSARERELFLQGAENCKCKYQDTTGMIRTAIVSKI